MPLKNAFVQVALGSLGVDSLNYFVATNGSYATSASESVSNIGSRDLRLSPWFAQAILQPIFTLSIIDILKAQNLELVRDAISKLVESMAMNDCISIVRVQDLTANGTTSSFCRSGAQNVQEFISSPSFQNLFIPHQGRKKTQALSQSLMDGVEELSRIENCLSALYYISDATFEEFQIDEVYNDLDTLVSYMKSDEGMGTFVSSISLLTVTVGQNETRNTGITDTDILPRLACAFSGIHEILNKNNYASLLVGMLYDVLSHTHQTKVSLLIALLKK